MNRPANQAFYFGPDARPLYGFIHHPEATARRNIGIVLCNPLGYEAICTQRTYRHFALKAASMGFPALRFDYDGTGNSSGLELDPNRVATWVDNICTAIDVLKQQSGVERVCLFGLRVGASLAVTAGLNRDDIEAVIAFAPVVSARSYLREIRALALSRATPDASQESSASGIQEAAGFATTEETRTELSKIDLQKYTARSAQHFCVFNRDDLPSNDGWPGHLIALGATVARNTLHGYVDMMRDAHSSVVPTNSIDVALQWLVALTSLAPPNRFEPASLNQRATFSVTNAESPPQSVTETLVSVGKNHPLFGVVTETTAPHPVNNRKQVVVLLNSGTIHHIGPHRLYVTLARTCAAMGVVVLRVDIAGIGESPPHPGQRENVAYPPDVYHDIGQAVEFITATYGAANIHFAGVCSGAYHAFKAAARGIAARSAVVINPLTFFWKEGMSLEVADFQVTSETKRYTKTALDFASWLRVFRGEVSLVPALKTIARRARIIATHYMRDILRMLRVPLQDDLASELRRIAKQSTKIQFIFSSTDPGISLLYEQGGRTVKHLVKNRSVDVAVIVDADHTFTALQARDRLVALFNEHIKRHTHTP